MATLISCGSRLLPWPQNNKDYFDQSLDEIKLLKYVNTHDPTDAAGIVRLFDYFYYKVQGLCTTHGGRCGWRAA